MEEQSFLSRRDSFGGDKEGLTDDKKWYEITRFDNLEGMSNTLCAKH